MTVSMSKRLLQFEQRCISAGFRPSQALKRARLHKSLWWKWRAGKVSPTLDKFEAAESGLLELINERAAAVSMAVLSPTARCATTDKSAQIVGHPTGELPEVVR